MPIDPPPTPWVFPDPRAVDDDLVGIGADLEPGTVLGAYRAGLFPMPFDDRPRAPMGWWSPERRGVLEPGGLKVSRSLHRSCRRFEIRVDTAFEEVIEACADPARPHGWISNGIRSAYLRLHELGWVHSVEAWRDGRLAGGLYGVAVGGLFAGESMFHRETDASKVALVGLVDLLDDEHVAERLVDVQWATPHLTSLGVVEVEREDYLDRLGRVLACPLPTAFS
ncbi:leucyl/phenylalanyl-tRNA--protein transferase [Nocardioides guangzhouensis]|uniref:Leucyl/phenylalanyl-tRNA--protein transferase n=1 Tax=Nocardioides guangzhouensis TaxID=2497878 RepID=A0A4Q4ZMF0_9ACTN|nr:leucyl/phenylalanyl-tRNA--protein transferase [Nocardioides guangzhouensis]RYP88716.1 leucyl/phenylalanyl-tRNA--protein transferase [Nocardioides guangzhouensis]